MYNLRLDEWEWMWISIEQREWETDLFPSSSFFRDRIKPRLNANLSFVFPSFMPSCAYLHRFKNNGSFQRLSEDMNEWRCNFQALGQDSF